jgi:hypothetical protein
LKFSDDEETWQGNKELLFIPDFNSTNEGVKHVISEKLIWMVRMITYLIRKRIIKDYEAFTKARIEAENSALDIKIKTKKPRNFVIDDENNSLDVKPFVLDIIIFQKLYDLLKNHKKTAVTTKLINKLKDVFIKECSDCRLKHLEKGDEEVFILSRIVFMMY